MKMEEKEMNSQDIDSKKREAIDGQIAEDGEKTGIDRNVNRQCAMAREMARQIALLVINIDYDAVDFLLCTKQRLDNHGDNSKNNKQ